MATIQEASIGQSTLEARAWVADFTGDLPSGVTVLSGSAVHIPPSGNALTASIITATPYVTATLDKPTVIGVHYLDIVATFSDGETSSVRVAFAVNYPSTQARAGMLDLVGDLRLMTDAGPADYKVAGLPYWSDAQLQQALDRRRMDVYGVEIDPIMEYSAGTYTYTLYPTGYNNLESGSAFAVKDLSGNTCSTAAYSVDCRTGLVTWGANTGGSALYLTARVYDVERAAMDVWRRKAAHYASAYDFSTDGHDLKRSQLQKQAMQMAGMYASMAKPQGVVIERSDT